MSLDSQLADALQVIHGRTDQLYEILYNNLLIGSTGPVGSIGPTGPIGEVGSTGPAGPGNFISTDAFMVAGGYNKNTMCYSYDGHFWLNADNSPFSGENAKCNTVIWNGSIWLAGGYDPSGRTLAMSSDGKVWINISENPFGIDGQCISLAWNGSMWLAGGSTQTDPAIFYSTDGFKWNPTTIPFINGTCNALGWNGSMWICGGNSNSSPLAYSYDGILWQHSSPVNSFDSCPFGNDDQVFSVAWNGSIWLAGGVGTTALASSFDGIQWTFISSALSVCYSLAWNGSMWVACGLTENSPAIVYSTNGSRWIPAVLSISDYGTGIYSLAWNGSYWIAGTDGSVNMLSSSDGINWSNLMQVSIGVFTLASRRVLPYGTTSGPLLQNKILGESFLVGGSNTGLLTYSYDGKVWNSSLTNPFIGGECLTVAWNGCIWLAGGGNSNNNTKMCQLALSPDGKSWISLEGSSSLFSGGQCNSIAWNGSMWVAGGSAGSSSTTLKYSFDGIQWIACANNPFDSSGICFSVAWNGSIWVAGGSGSTMLAVSYNGITWNIPKNNNIFGLNGKCLSIAWNGTMWVAGGSGRIQLAWSLNGQSWTYSRNTLFSGGQCNSIAWNGSMWLAGGTDGTNTNALISSTDGQTWSIVQNSSLIKCNSVVWNGSVWVVMGYINTIYTSMYSTDLITWTIQSAPLNINSMASRRTLPYIPLSMQSYIPQTPSNWPPLATPTTTSQALDVIAKYLTDIHSTRWLSSAL